MILTMFIVGLLITYLSIGLFSGRAYLLLKLRNWHNTKGVKLKTKNQIKQEEELEVLQAKNKYEEYSAKNAAERKRLVSKLAAANDRLDYLRDEKRRLEKRIAIEGRDAFAIKVETIKETAPMQIWDAASKTIGNMYDSICGKLPEATEATKRANREIDDFDQHQHRFRKKEHDFLSYSSSYCKNYEDEREEFKNELNPYAISMTFLWPFMASWFIGRYAVMHVINFGDRILHADNMKNYVAPDEHKLEAKIKALTEKDPELAKMYHQLAESLEA